MLFFKKWIENTSTTCKIALVGWSNTAKDHSIMRQAGKFLEKDPNTNKKIKHAQEHSINDQDFLQDKQTYDAILLCWINKTDQKPEEWRKRLLATKAEYIFAAGAGTEVSGQFLGTLPGYMARSHGYHLTIYIHENKYR